MSHARPENSGPPVRVMVLSDVRLYCEGLTRLLAGAEAIDVVGSGPVNEDSLCDVGVERPDVVLLEAAAACDANIVRSIRNQAPDAHVVAYGIVDEDTEALRCAEAGATAFVSGEATADQLVTTILGVKRGEFRCSPRVGALLVRRVQTLSQEVPPVRPARLTPREHGVLGLIAEGLSNKEIAARLGIRLCTVKNHVHHILEKMQASRRSQAVARYRRLRKLDRGSDRARRSGS